MKYFLVLFSLFISFTSCMSTNELSIASDGKANATIVLCDAAESAEQTAARELGDYLGKVTGATFSIASETDAPSEGMRIYIGPTKYAKDNGIDAGSLAPEEWIMRTINRDLVLLGGRPRGTLYAVYRFLEDIVDVHWWNPWEESVPNKPTLTIGVLSQRGKPTFSYRDIFMLYGNDGGRFAARNRLNRDGDATIAREYGGCNDYGPPYHVHTFYLYVPPEIYFQSHPEWFSLINGKREWDGKQLCLSNQALREFVLEKLRGYVRSARQEAEKTGVLPPQVFDISPNDWYGGMCQCENCQAIATAEGTEAGILIDFLNYVAGEIIKEDEFRDIYLSTEVFNVTLKAPKTIKPRDNVIVRLCDMASNLTKPITDPENNAFRENLLSWKSITKNLRIWDYAVTFFTYHGLPMPSVYTYLTDYQFYAKHNIEGVFTEHEYPILADMRDFKIWMMIKLLEDPFRDYDELVMAFTDNFYGPAGQYIREYLQKLEAASEAKPSYISMWAWPREYHYLDLDFIMAAQGIFTQAEDIVAGDPVLLRRVRHARLPLDRAAVVCYQTLMNEWVAAGNAPGTMPLDRDAIAERYKQTWYTQTDIRMLESLRTMEKKAAAAEVARLLAIPGYMPLPEKFSGLPLDAVFDYTANTARNFKDIVRVVADSQAESGITNRLEFPTEIDADQHPVEKYKLPMEWGIYDWIHDENWGPGAIEPGDVPGPGYHWYKLGSFGRKPAAFVYFFWSWIIQVDIGDRVDPKNPGQKFDVWARIKFEGPAFPYGKPDEKNAISIERVVLVKSNS